MAKFIVDGEFGTETIEAESLQEAAVETANKYAGLDSDDISEDPWWFSVAPEGSPDNVSEFLVEWTREDGLVVYDSEGDPIEM